MTTLSSDIESIPINLIRQHQFCPRIPWYKLVLKFDPPEQAWMIQGKQWHDKQHDLQKRRVSLYSSDNAVHHHEAWVHCPELGIHGQVDHLIEEQEYSIVIEYKIDSKSITNGRENLIMEIRVKDYSSLTNEISKIEGVVSVTLMHHEGEVKN